MTGVADWKLVRVLNAFWFICEGYCIGNDVGLVAEQRIGVLFAERERRSVGFSEDLEGVEGIFFDCVRYEVKSLLWTQDCEVDHRDCIIDLILGMSIEGKEDLFERHAANGRFWNC